MGTGYRGAFVLSWAQTEVDGLRGAPPDQVECGSAWRWSGVATRVDDPADVLVLTGGEQAALRRHAARQVGRLLGDPDLALRDEADGEAETGHLFRSGFDVTDGRALYNATMVDVERAEHPLVLFVGALPPAETDLWVVNTRLEARPTAEGATPPGVMCFIPGTEIRTPDGARRVEDLRVGDRIQTKDNGPQAIAWIGGQNISGARLQAMPHLRPVRLRAGGLCEGEPDADLFVSPDHRLLLRGRVARTLFSTEEVFVSARDLINDCTVTVDRACREVHYVHLLLERHEVVWANGVECESFHPEGTSLDRLDPEQRAALLAAFPGVIDNPARYGAHARRELTRAEAALLAYGAAVGH